MKLYEIDERLRKCVVVDEDTIVDGETGEIIDFDTIKALEMERDNKVIQLGRWVKEMLAEAEAIKAEKMKLAKRQSSLENKAESIKAFLSSYLNEGETFKDATTVIKWRKSEQVKVDLDKLLKADGCDEYLRYKDPEADKTKIKQALKAGKEIAGCSLESKNNLQIG